MSQLYLFFFCCCLGGKGLREQEGGGRSRLVPRLLDVQYEPSKKGRGGGCCC